MINWNVCFRVGLNEWIIIKRDNCVGKYIVGLNFCFVYENWVLKKFVWNGNLIK